VAGQGQVVEDLSWNAQGEVRGALNHPKDDQDAEGYHGGDDLVRAIEAVGRGEALLDPALTQRVFERVREAQRKDEKSAFSDLTDQEMRVLVLLAEGKTNREIAQLLYLGEGTVRNYVSSILSKLGLANRAEAAAYAVQHKIKTFQEIS